jgi:hypothetical protein
MASDALVVCLVGDKSRAHDYNITYFCVVEVQDPVISDLKHHP